MRHSVEGVELEGGRKSNCREFKGFRTYTQATEPLSFYTNNIFFFMIGLRKVST